MPLHVYPSSTCDVCQEEYYNTWQELQGERTPRVPCSIRCGHVFCTQCLRSIRVTICPLCREPYDPQDITKLHVDQYTADDFDALAREEVKAIRAMVVGFQEPSEFSEYSIDEVLGEAHRWLVEGQDPYASTVRSGVVKAVYDALFIYKRVRHQHVNYSQRISQLQEALDCKDAELDQCKLVEQSLIEAQVKEDQKRKINMELLKAREEEVEQHRKVIQSLHTEIQNLQARYMHTSNPLPAPPVPVDINLSRIASAPVRVDDKKDEHTRARRDLLHAVKTDGTKRARSDLKLPTMVPGAPPDKRVILDENTLDPVQVVGRPQHAQVTFNSVDADQTPTHRPIDYSTDYERRRSTRYSSSSREERDREADRPPRSQPRPFPNAAAIENLPPAPGLGLFDPSQPGPSRTQRSYTPAPMPAPSAAPLPTALPTAESQWGTHRPGTSASIYSRNGSHGSLTSSSVPPASALYGQQGVLSDLNLGLTEIPAPITQPPSSHSSAASSLTDLGVFGLRDIPASAPPVQASFSRNASSTTLLNASSNNSSNSNVALSNSTHPSIQAPRPALAGSRNSDTASSAPRMERRRVSFDPDTHTIRRLTIEDDDEIDEQEVFSSHPARTSTRTSNASRGSRYTEEPTSSLGLAISSGVPSGQVVSGLNDLDHVNNSLTMAIANGSMEERRERRRSRSHRESSTYPFPEQSRRSPVMDIDPQPDRPSTSVSLGGIYRDARSTSRSMSRAMAHATAPVPIASPRPVDARPSAAPHVLDRDRDSDATPLASHGDSSRRRSRRRDSVPAPSAERAHDAHHGSSSNTSLLLNFTPAGPGASEAHTSDRLPSSIHAPRPSRHNSNNFGQWFSSTNH